MSHRLLIDNNLSHKLVEPLCRLGFDTQHVKAIGMQEAGDYMIWNHAKTNGFHILTKDLDFSHIVALRGFSPKVIQLDVGNRSTKVIIELIQTNVAVIKNFLTDNESGLLVLI